MQAWLTGLSWQVLLPEGFLVVAVVALWLTELWRPAWVRWVSYAAISGMVIMVMVLLQFFFQRQYRAFGGALFLDNFGLLTVVLYFVVGTITAIAVWPRLEEHQDTGRAATWLGLLFISMLALMVITTTLSLVAMFIAIELLSLALYLLIALESPGREGLESATKYFLLGAFAGALFGYGMALVYGATGSFSMGRILAWLNAAPGASAVGLVAVGLGFLLVGLGFKGALVPFHMWVPDVYQGAPTALTGYMSVAVKIAAFGAMYRLFRDVFLTYWNQPAVLGPIFAVLAGLTMTVGNLAALRQHQLKRLLAYSSIAHAGYMVLGLLAGGPDGREALLLYLFAYSFMNLGAFLVLDVLELEGTSATLEAHRGLGIRKPGWALSLAVFLLSLTGIPPTAGFVAKFWIFRAALGQGWFLLVMLAVVNSVVAAFYYMRWVVVMFLPAEAQTPSPRRRSQTMAPALVGYTFAVLLCVFLTLQMGLFPGRFIRLVRFAWPGT